MTRAGLACALALAAVAAPAPARAADPPLVEGRRAVTAQGQQYGIVPPQAAVSVRVRAIFDRLVRAAGRRPGLLPEVSVLDTAKIIAESFRGGLVVISRGTADLAAGDDHALAWLLGHELAHLVRDHHALLDSMGVLGAGAGTMGVPGEQVVRAYRAVELDADRLGTLYAVLAGYRPAAGVDMVARLTEHVGPDTFHPEPRERAAAIRTQITEISDRLEVFNLGLFLLTTGRYLDAARVLEHFLALFPSREVMLAVGVAYHREALRHAAPAEFRHAVLVDPATRATGVKGSPPALRSMLDRAVRYYTFAVDADGAYAPALNDLAAAYLDLGERDLALAYAARAVQSDPKLAAAYVTRGAARALAGDVGAAEADFVTAAALDPAARAASLNLARLYERQGRVDEARRWAARAMAPPAGPAPEALGALAPGAAIAAAEWQREPGTREIRVPLGGEQAQELSLWILSRRGVAVAARGGVIEAVGSLPGATVATRRGLRVGDAGARVETAYGRPDAIDTVQGTRLVGFHAPAVGVFLAEDRVRAIWVGSGAAR
ncbi:MAG: M48 family metalloprotease [Candidatus Rokubacteria bacterium]|nr:M48 family metalloprotease [Candidatus Rokubacteria bacterium]